jgi:nucleoside-diphosphate-sugar epimerase
MRILIFGASGFIGAHLTRYASSAGHEVVALCRSGRVAGFSGECLKWSFGKQLTTSTMEAVSCAIHLAHDFNGTDGARLTLKETLANVSRLRAAGVERQIFFSSYSAGEHATSLYGRTKMMIEIGLGATDDIIIVRPGLVLGEGGIYGRICKWARRLPVIPLPDGGYGQVPVIDVVRLCRATLLIVEATAPDRECNLFERQPLILRQLVLDAAAKVGRKPWIVNVPTSLIILGLRFATAMRLPLPVNADNLQGFMANQVAMHKSTLQD